MATVCFDTNFVIWGVKHSATPGQESNIPRVRHVVETCAKNNDRIIVPSLVLAEVLSGLPSDRRNEFARTLAGPFIIVPFDARAALIYAEMWDRRPRNTGYKREMTKTDYLIAAVAVANQCKCIYSNDPGLRRFAEDHVPVLGIDDIPEPPEQLNLLDSGT